MKPAKSEARARETRAASENMRRLMLGFRSLLETEIRREGLTLSQLRMLKAIDQKQGVSSAELARTCLVTPQSMQAVLARAVREQWITRAHAQRNDRILTASLTPLGEEMLRRGMAVLAKIEDRVWAGSKTGELRELNRMLATAVEQLERSLPAQDEAAPLRPNLA